MKYFILFKKKVESVSLNYLHFLFFFFFVGGKFYSESKFRGRLSHVLLSLSLCIFFPSQTQCLTPGETPGLIDVEERSACHTPRCN